MPSTLTAQEFVAKWRRAELKERSASQEHFLDLCRLVGHPTPAEADPTGEWFTFEAGVEKAGGGNGFADVWKRDYFAWEYKGRHANLDEAYQQLLRYKDALYNPPLLVVCDLDRIVIHTNFTNTAKRVIEIGLEELLQWEKLEQLQALFADPFRFRSPRTTAQVTEEAAQHFARLSDLLRRHGEDPQRAAHFLIRLLFCLFAEDIGLLPKGLFTRLVEQTRRTPGAFTAQLRQLFSAMAGGGWFGADQIEHFNGGLFEDDSVLSLDSEGLEILDQVSRLDWAGIEPSILGTLFERSLDPSRRAQLGAHYTSREDILLIVEPVLMEPLRRRWQEVEAQARDLASRRDGAGGGARTRYERQLVGLLLDFSGETAQVQVLDPACGSGNFLYVALRELLGLWKAVSTLAFELGLPLMYPWEAAPDPSQLHGIEVNPYAHELAQATVWIGYIQWLHENGFGSRRDPILKPLHNILHMDAILAHDEEGHPVEPQWPEADIIIGNPPFLGDKKMRGELGHEYVENLRRLYSGRLPGQSDLCCYWFEKARAMIEEGRAKRAGLLATQGIRGGANRTVLERIKETGDIFWAQSDRNWVLDGATVHVSMVGFGSGDHGESTLNGVCVSQIHADLTSSVDLTSVQRLPENEGIAFIGTQKTGAFDLTTEQAREMLLAVGNPNGRDNSDVVKPWVNAIDITRRPRDAWIIDFGVGTSPEDAAGYETPFEYVREHVKPHRDGVRRKSHRDRWWLFGETRPGMREAVSSRCRYIVTPHVSKHRVFAWVPRGVIAENLLIVFARDDDYFLGVLHSKIHELWARSQGTQLREAESGFRYTSTTTFETFPFPWPPGHEPQDDPRVRAIAEAARDLVEKRGRWLNPPGAEEKELKRRTLTNLYNQRPTWLDLAHRRLDEAVLDAYAWPHDLEDEEILERLLALNLERAGESA